MREKHVKARKEHECSYCGKLIKKGEIYLFMTGRFPDVDEFDIQKGIEYVTVRYHKNVPWCENIDLNQQPANKTNAIL
jgi:hypothetical protein